MSGFDDLGVFFSDNLASDDANNQANRTTFQGAKKKFKEFLRNFHEGNFMYKYRYAYVR